MQRFFVAPDLLKGSSVTLHGDIAHQITRVLRMRPGERVLLLDGEGFEYAATLEEVGKESVLLAVGDRHAGPPEPTTPVCLYLSLLNKPDKFEWALQKCTELGISRFVPVEAARSVAAGPSGGSKYERWERIVKEAAEQSGRTRLPHVARSTSFSDAVRAESERSRTDPRHLTLFPILESCHTLKSALQSAHPRSVSIFIGPEGGFTAGEVELAQRSDIRLVTLGPRTLRAETAAVAASTIVMYELGELDVIPPER